MATRLFHFSDDGSIKNFAPRAVSIASKRPKGSDWLNGPLVWAIDDWHQPMYMFPRDCPRILLWRTANTTKRDAETYFGDSHARIVAYMEKRWLDRLQKEALYRYEFPIRFFEPLNDAGMWVSKTAVRPKACSELRDLPALLSSSSVELRCLDLLAPLKEVWKTSLHASGIRLRNARGWDV